MTAIFAVSPCNREDSTVFSQVALSEEDQIHHYHVAKTGGTTVDYFMRKLFPRHVDALAETPYYRWRSNHTYSVVWLREPHEWLFSAVYHDLGMERIKLSGSTFRLADALNQSAHMRGHRNLKGYDYQDFQTRFLVGKTRGRLSDFLAAKRVLDCIDVVGIAEYMSESICLLMYKFSHPEFSRCSCAFKVEQRNARVGDKNYHLIPESERFAMFGRYTDFASIGEYLRTDELVYSYALQRFLADISAVEKASGVKLLCDRPK